YLRIECEQNQYQYLKLSGFTDTYDNWAAQTIEELFRYCVVSGYTDGTFKPNQNITRAEAITMINRMLYRGPLTGAEPSFPDNSVDKWCFCDIEEATRTHYYTLNRDGNETMTRCVEEDLW
ncbi:MAG: S-layer homology domain-containing protein, partial [Clostridiales bacterium]|nr:S-layer homology domain-containing protein [Clostridiales bacterium]